MRARPRAAGGGCVAGEDLEPAEWVLAFYGRERGYWADWLSRPGWRHVGAMGYVPHHGEHGTWLHYEVGRTGTAILADPFGDYTAGRLAALRRAGATFLRVEARPSRRWMGRLGFWCVPAVAHLVGVDALCLTPRQLYRHLVARGALPAFS